MYAVSRHFFGRPACKYWRFISYKIGPVIRDIRKDKGLLIEEVAAKTGISVSTLGQVEQGGRNLSMKNLYMLMEVYETDANSLLAMYSMSVSKFMQLAKDAKACYKVNQLVLVNLDIIDEYLETFHIVDDEFYK